MSQQISYDDVTTQHDDDRMSEGSRHELNGWCSYSVGRSWWTRDVNEQNRWSNNNRFTQKNDLNICGRSWVIIIPIIIYVMWMCTGYYHRSSSSKDTHDHLCSHILLKMNHLASIYTGPHRVNTKRCKVSSGVIEAIFYFGRTHRRKGPTPPDPTSDITRCI